MKFSIAVLPLFLVLLATSCQSEKETKTNDLFVGTYTNGDSEGIYHFQFNPETGALTKKVLAATLNNPSFLKISADKKHLYSVMETDEFEGSTGGVMAFELAPDRTLKEIGPKATVGAHPCHIALSDDGGYLTASSYTGGSASIFRLGDTGALGAEPQFIDFKLLDTLKISHAHSAEFTPDGLFIADLGLDAVMRFTHNGQKFVPHEQPSLDLAEGAGPRHFTRNENGQFLYVINELNATITVFEKSGNDYNSVASYPTLAEDYKGESYCADIHLSHDGQFLYGSNRGENSIVIFKVDSETGRLDLVGRHSVHGDWPRNFAIDPSGKFLLVANQKSSNITVFKRDLITGTLGFLHEVKLPNPVCLEFL